MWYTSGLNIFPIFPIRVEPMITFSDLFEPDLQISQVTGTDERTFTV